VILVVSMDTHVRDTAAAVLRRMGETVMTASTTRDGLRKAPDVRVVVLDLLTEGLDGPAFKDAAAPVVVISLHEEMPILIGADRYSKPFTLARLKEALAIAA
jgi:DNA-binding NtrC family response regulator